MKLCVFVVNTKSSLISSSITYVQNMHQVIMLYQEEILTTLDEHKSVGTSFIDKIKKILNFVIHFQNKQNELSTKTRAFVELFRNFKSHG